MSAYSTPAARWRAVSTRDAAAANTFVYLVRSTRIYCRPNCSARPARRANVEFRSTAAEAERDGYRACKRCKPEQLAYNPQIDAVMKAYNLIANLGPNDPLPTTEELSKAAGLTKSHFHRTFKSVVGTTPKDFAQQCRQVVANAQPINTTTEPSPIDSGYQEGTTPEEPADLVSLDVEIPLELSGPCKCSDDKQSNEVRS